MDRLVLHGVPLVIRLDGGPARQDVIAYDLDAGWLEVYCSDGEGPHAGGFHIDPDDPDRMCVRTLYGAVTVEAAP